MVVVIFCTDAVPKKRGPKTDVLEALLKRVDGLEAKLKEKKDQPGASTADPASLISSSTTIGPAGSPSPTAAASQGPSTSKTPVSGDNVEVKPQSVPPAIDTTRSIDAMESAVYTPSSSRYAKPILSVSSRRRNPRLHTDVADNFPQCSAPSPSVVQADVLLDTYFSRFHAKPFYILDESSVRQRLQLNQLPTYLIDAIYAVAARCVQSLPAFLLRD